MGAALGAHIAAEDTILLGRVTYQEWAPYWPTSTDEPYASHINNTPKYVVSTTLDKVEWQNSKLVKSSLADEINRLKRQPGNNIGGAGSPTVCHCYPRINISTARPPYGDRLVMIGDSGATRLYKDGIGADYRTAKAAARTAVFHGVTAEDFREYYWPLCRKIQNDNYVGKLVFWFGGLIQKAGFARRGVPRMIEEQQQSKGARRMSSVLWDMFSGSAPSTDIFLRTLRPAFIGSLAWNLVAGNLPGNRGVGTTGREEQVREHAHVHNIKTKRW